MQIDLEPGKYRETGRARIVRSILHKPVFLTISTLLGAWVALALGVAQASGGFGRVPDWAAWTLYPSFAVGLLFLVFCVVTDGDREERPAPAGKPLAPAKRVASQAPARWTSKIFRSSRQGGGK